MSKKKNVRRKKSNNLLKGVAAAGAVVGGGTIFAGNNAVYAAEVGDETQVSSFSESQASTSTYMSESLSQSDSTTVDYASIENSTNASVLASASDSTVESENNSIVESNSISDSVNLSESQLTSTSESESTSVSVSDSESLVNSETVKNDEVSSNKFGNLINGLFNNKVSVANYTTPTGKGSAMFTAKSESDDPETSMSKYFSESTARSESLTLEYGKEFASEVLTKNSYIVEGDNDLIKKGVLVQKDDGGYKFTYITTSNGTKTIDLNEHNVIKDESNNITGINWDGYWINSDGTIEKISSLPDTFTDLNDKSGNKEFMTIKENGQDKNVYVVKKNGYWVPIKVNDNYVEIQEKGNKIYNEIWHESYVQIKIGEKKYYLDGAYVENNHFFALSWDYYKDDFALHIFIKDVGKITYDRSFEKLAIKDMYVNKTSYSETNSTVVSESESLVSESESTSTSVANSQSTSTSVANSQSTSTSVANSQSTSTSVANSQSTSTSESKSTSESVNTSESISESISESLSVSESESISGSMSDSVSTSTAVSESLSNSLSSSESNSLSSSESTSVSDSFATSVTTTITGGDTTYRRVVVDTRAPLQVAPRETEEVVEDETPKANPVEQTETIEKEKMPKSTLDVTHRVWWSWVPIVGALVSLVNAHASKKARNDASKERNDASKEKEDK